MIEFKCDVCGSSVVVNFKRTVEVFAEELGYIIEKGESILDDTIQDYLVYTCMQCYKVYKLSLEEIEFRLRRDAAQLALARRRTMVFNRQLPFVDVNKDMLYCGLCGGVDEDKTGMCFSSLMDVCTIRKKHLEK